MNICISSSFEQCQENELLSINGGSWDGFWNGVAIAGAGAIAIASLPATAPVWLVAAGCYAVGTAAGYQIFYK